MLVQTCKGIINMMHAVFAESLAERDINTCVHLRFIPLLLLFKVWFAGELPGDAPSA